MTYLAARARCIFAAAMVGGLVAFAAPALAQRAGAPIDPQADVVNEQTLLREFPRIQGEINQLDQRARVLIQPAGRTWDYFHQVVLRWIGAIAIIGALAALAAAYFLLGRLRITAGRSGRKILRFKPFERLAHWLTAVSFVVLAITGLNITFGKALLLPLIGPDGFSALSQYAKYTHNFVSFAFVLGVFPLVVAHGAGAEMRRTLGTAVFAGMLGVTFFGLVLTPVFYSVVRRFAGRPSDPVPPP